MTSTERRVAMMIRASGVCEEVRGETLEEAAELVEFRAQGADPSARAVLDLVARELRGRVRR
jgi:uncharacterized protein (DUF2235 family)